MEVVQTKLEGCLIIQPKIFSDDRGHFLETFQVKRYSEMAGIDTSFVQDNLSRSNKNVLRGLHFQKNKPQGKLVRATSGTVYDVAVDLRPGSPTFGEWEAVVLSGENKTQLWVPPGFAHGFMVLSDFADFEYKCTEYYDPGDEGSIIWNDPHLAISWPSDAPHLSEKDANAPLFAELQL